MSNTTETATLADFLFARIVEDEAAAHDAVALRIHWDRAWEHELGAHIARHDPARVLAQCAAYRAIVDLHSVAHYCANGVLQDPIGPPFFGADERLRDCDTLRALASIWADHDEYRPEWANV